MATRKRIFCDTNFLLDVFDVEREHHADAVALLWYAADNPKTVELTASITSFKDAYYILTRLYRDEEEARDSIESVMGDFVRPVDMLASYGAEALATDEPDFEDALIAVSAEHEGASVLISRDKRAFEHCPIPKLSASEFLKQERFDYGVIEF